MKKFTCIQFFILAFGLFNSLHAMEQKSTTDACHPSLTIVRAYMADKIDTDAFDLLETDSATEEDVSGAIKKISPGDLLFAPFMRGPAAVGCYRKIISAETAGLHSYHGYDKYSALVYDVYTMVGEQLNDGQKQQARSRFRFSKTVKPYESVDEFLSKEHFSDDHQENFTTHGISAVPHLFSCTSHQAENCISGIYAPFLQMAPETVNTLIKNLGFKDGGKYISLIEKHHPSKRGFLTRFTFSDDSALNQATYPAPLRTSDQRYGLPWQIISASSVERKRSSELVSYLKVLDSEGDGKDFLFNMQYRNIFIPFIYNNSDSVKTTVFSWDEMKDPDGYYQTLREYVQEDMQDLTAKQIEQATLWLK